MPRVGGIQEQNTPKRHPSTKAKEHEQSFETETLERILSVVTKIEEEQAEVRKVEGAVKTSDEDIQNKLANYTLGLLFVGLVQALILAGTIYAIITQTRAHKDSERAWIIASPIDKSPAVGFVPGPGDPLDAVSRGQKNIFGCAFKNTGETPARLIDSAVLYRLADTLEAIPGEPAYGERGSLNNLLLVKSDSIGGVAFLYPQVILSKAEAIDVANGEKVLYAYGIVTYRDIFGRSHETRFGYIYHQPLGGDPRPREFRREGIPPAYNRAT